MYWIYALWIILIYSVCLENLSNLKIIGLSPFPVTTWPPGFYRLLVATKAIGKGDNPRYSSDFCGVYLNHYKKRTPPKFYMPQNCLVRTTPTLLRPFARHILLICSSWYAMQNSKTNAELSSKDLIGIHRCIILLGFLDCTSSELAQL